MNTRQPLVIYHGNCDDGFGAAFIINQALGGKADFWPGVYGKSPPNVTDRDVILVDFSYKKDVLEEMKQSAATILILDHHKTAQEDLAGWPQIDHKSNLHTFATVIRDGERRWNCLFDMTRSGAGIAWDFFNPGIPRPLFVSYLEDRDLWKKQLPNGDEFTIAVRSYPQTFEMWGELAGRGVDKLILEGRSLQRYYRLRVEEFKRASYVAKIGKHTCRIANAPYFAASEVAGELHTPDVDFGAAYFEKGPEQYQYSFRSRTDFDVSAVALDYGGGGHKSAAGVNVEELIHFADDPRG